MIDAPRQAAQSAKEDTAVRELALPDLAATGRLAASLARLARTRDVFALAGPLGVGKTALARAFIRALGGEEEVPSPTFTLLQGYALQRLTLYHFDLYRLAKPADAYELGIEEAFVDGVSVIEWPERLGPLLPRERLDVALEFGAAPDARRARLTGHGAWARRLRELRP